MNKCFITKLPSSVDNDNLPVLGQLRINWLKQSNLTDNDARAIGLSTNDSITIKVSGAHLTDSTLVSNLGNTKTITAADGFVWLYVSNEADAILTIDNKYSLTSLNFIKPAKDRLKRSVKFDISDIRYCTALTDLGLSNTQVIGDISAVSQLTALTSLVLSHNQIGGDISAVSQLTALMYLDLSYNQVIGDISTVSKLTALTSLRLPNTNVSGNINAVSNLSKLTNLALENTQVSGDINAVSNLSKLENLGLENNQVSGAVDSLANFTKLTRLPLRGLSLTGDMSKIPTKVVWISQLNRRVNTNFTWTANGRQNAAFLAMEGQIPFDTTSMDNMLIDQATCTFKGNDAYSWEKTLSVSGTRTSASDAAVAAIQNKGITIIGVTKQA